MYWADCCVDNSNSSPETTESSVNYSGLRYNHSYHILLCTRVLNILNTICNLIVQIYVEYPTTLIYTIPNLVVALVYLPELNIHK